MRAIAIHNNQTVPFLSSGELVTYEFSEWQAAEDLPVKWVKDTHISGLTDPPQVELAYNKIDGTTSKRLSRLFRLYLREWCQENPALDLIDSGDKVATDGQSLISSGAVQLLYKGQFPKDAAKLAHAKRVELTYMSPVGQVKGHAHIVPDKRPWIRTAFAGIKSEVRIDRTFLGVMPVHAQKGIWLDIQSWINLRRFFEPFLLPWLDKWLAEAKETYGEAFAKALFSLRSPSDLSKFANYTEGFALACGADVQHFERLSRAAMRAALSAPAWSKAKQLRWHVPYGYKLYAASDWYEKLQVPQGAARIDYERATLWLNSTDWVNWIQKRLGGADGDDMLWVVPFRSVHSGKAKLLAWRSPNQFGEYILMDAEHLEDDLPEMDETLLPLPIEQQPIQYEHMELTPLTAQSFGEYVELVQRNRGVLGRYINLLMVHVAQNWSVPERLPAPLEQIIDGTVKVPADLSPVTAWIEQWRMETANTPAPHVLASRNRVTKPEWNEAFDGAISAMRQRILSAQEYFENEVFPRCMPPVKLWRDIPYTTWKRAEQAWRAFNAEARRLIAYHREMEWLISELGEEMPELDFTPAIRAFNTYAPSEFDIDFTRAALCLPYLFQEADGKQRHESALWTAQPDWAIEALRRLTLIGEPVTIGNKIELIWNAEQLDERDLAQPVVVSVAAPWYSLYIAATGTKPRMADIPKEVRETYKKRAEALAGQFASAHALYNGTTVVLRTNTQTIEVPLKRNWSATPFQGKAVAILPDREDWRIAIERGAECLS